MQEVIGSNPRQTTSVMLFVSEKLGSVQMIMSLVRGQVQLSPTSTNQEGNTWQISNREGEVVVVSGLASLTLTAFAVRSCKAPQGVVFIYNESKKLFSTNFSQHKIKLPLWPNILLKLCEKIPVNLKI